MCFTEIDKIDAIGAFLINYNNVLKDYNKLIDINNDSTIFGDFLNDFLIRWKVIRCVPADKEIRSNI